jgi:hypothetical protein
VVVGPDEVILYPVFLGWDLQMKGAWAERVNYNSKGCLANLRAAFCVAPPRSLLRVAPDSDGTAESTGDVEAPNQGAVPPVDHPMLAVLPRV